MMSHEVFERSAYSYMIPMWHQLRRPSVIKMSAEEVLDKEFSSGYWFNVVPFPSIVLDGEIIESNYRAIIRGPFGESKAKIIDVCTDRYNLLQPREIAQSFDMNVGEYVETMAFLSSGKEMFISWEMPPFDILLSDGTKDGLKVYGIVRIGFDTKSGAKLFTSIYRPVCANTINLAERQGEHIWRGTGVNQNLLRDLGYWLEHVQGRALAESEILQKFLSRMAENPIDDDGVKSVLFKAFPDSEDFSHRYPKQLREEKAQKIADYNDGQARIRDGIYALWAGKGTSIYPDFWGVVCSASEFFCHYQPSKRPIAESVMFGARQNHMVSVINALSERLQ